MAALTDLGAPNLYDLQRPEIIADPWPSYDRLRADSPHWDRTVRSWLVSRHDQVTRVLTHPAFTAAMDHGRVAAIAPPSMRHIYPLLDAHVSFVDGEAHARMRRVLADPFKPARVAALEARVAAVVDDALDRTAGGAMDVVTELAYPVPLRVVAELLGLDGADIATLRRWSNAWGDVVAAPGHLPTGDTTALLADVDELVTFLQATVAAHRSEPGRSVTDALIAACDRGELAEIELIANLMMLVTAGHETTANLIGNAVAALLDEPALAQRLRSTPELIATAVDEVARLHSPTQYTARTATSDVELGGRRIEAGQAVVLMLAAANRDPAAFPEPGRVRLDRPAAARPVAFGHGAHFCFGAPLARIETRLVLARLLARCANLRPAGPRRWRANANLRGLSALPIAVEEVR